jgi:cardiolipin synthase
MNISSVYSSSSFYPSKRSSRLEDSWRDTHIRLEGPIVAVFQRVFVDLWSRLRGEPPLSGIEYFPPLPDKGATLARVAISTVGDTESKIYRLYSSVFAHARRRIWVTQGYFSPNPRFLEVLKSAARRGVDVRLLLPGLTDSWITVSSSRSTYAGLLKAGVRVFERKDALQHAKTAVVDGIWCTVGSTNLDYRSFFHSNEANAIIYGREFGRQMEDLFLTDQEQNQEIRLPQWQNRNLGRRFMEFLGKLFRYWL